MTKHALTTEQLVLKAALEELYGAAIPDDEIIYQTEIEAEYPIVPLFSDEVILITEEDVDGEDRHMITLRQQDNPFYGQDFGEPTELFDKGYEEIVELVNERVDENGNVEYYQAGRTRQWVHPTFKPGWAA